PSAANSRSGSRPTFRRMPPGWRGSKAVAAALADHLPLIVPSVPSLQNVPRISAPAAQPTRSGAPWNTSPTLPSRVSTAEAAAASPGTDFAGGEEQVSAKILPWNSAEACSSGQSTLPSTGVPPRPFPPAAAWPSPAAAAAERRKRRVTTWVLARIQIPSTPAMAFLVKVPVISMTPSPSLPQPKPPPAF
ncbi:unnamed protein product, partial [Ectocarpus sp. 13 AM-2016]